MCLCMFEYENMCHPWGGIMTFSLKPAVHSEQNWWWRSDIVDVYDHFVPFRYLLATPADLLPLNFAISDFNCFQMIKHTSTGTCQKMRYTNQSIIRRPNARLWAQVPNRTLCLSNPTPAVGSVCNLYLLARARCIAKLLDHNKHTTISKLTTQCF